MYIGGNYYGRRLRGYECDNYYGHFDSNISVSNIRPTSSAVRIVRSTGHTAGSRPIYNYRLQYTEPTIEPRRHVLCSGILS